MAMNLYVQMDLIFRTKIEPSSQFKELASRVGYDAAKTECVHQMNVQAAQGTIMLAAITAAAVAAIVFAAAAALGITLGVLLTGTAGAATTTAVGGAAAQFGRIASTYGRLMGAGMPGGAAGGIGGSGAYYMSQAAGSPARFALIQILTSLGFGIAYGGGTTIGYNMLQDAVGATDRQEGQQARSAILSLGRMSDEELYALGFTSEEISAIRTCYEDLINEGLEQSGQPPVFDGSGGSGSSSPTDNQMPQNAENWINSYNQFLASGLNPDQAVTSTTNLYGWKLDDATLAPILQDDWAVYNSEHSTVPPPPVSDADKLAAFLDLYNSLRRSGLADTAAYDSAVSTLGYSPPNFPRPSEAITNDNVSQFEDWQGIYYDLRREGLNGAQAASQATAMVGWSPPQSVVDDMVAADNAQDAEANEEENTMVSAGDLINAFQETLYNDTSPMDVENEWRNDEAILSQFESKSNKSPSGGYARSRVSKTRVPDMGDSYTPPSGYRGYQGENENMSVRRRGSVWVWANSGRPVNGGRSRGGYRRSYRSRY